jgi:hypothetical protein
MTVASLIKLVNSLSSPEKRYFKLYSHFQGGNKEYLLLFELLDQKKNLDIPALKKAFQEKAPRKSWDNTCTYLGSVLLDSLVRTKKEKDVFFDLLHQIQEVRVLKERSLDEEAFKRIKKIRQRASMLQQHWIEYYCCRFELNYYADNNFPELTDESLIKLQMKGKEVLRNLNSIHDHYSLYELLKFRLIHAGKIVSEEGKKKLNDLMLSEMVLVSGKAKSFSTQKLHLLFQSFFFTDIGDYHSAVKSFDKLNELLEKNQSFLDNPPLDYLSALTGIVDSLRMLNNDSEVSYYLDKINSLDQAYFPEFFRYLVRKTFCIQQIVTLLHSEKQDEALTYVRDIPKDIFDNYSMIDEEKQSELYFYCSLVYFKNGNWQKAHLFIREIMNRLKLPEQLLVSKAIRLLNIVIYYEKNEMLHLEYEIRSYKRYFAQIKLLKTEKILFKVLTSSTANKRLRLMNNERRKILNELELIIKDRYEQQLLKYFDFAKWVGNIVEVKNKKIETLNIQLEAK